MLLLLPEDFFSPPWLDRLLLDPLDALAPPDDLEPLDDLRLDDDSEDLLLRDVAISCSLIGWDSLALGRWPDAKIDVASAIGVGGDGICL